MRPYLREAMQWYAVESFVIGTVDFFGQFVEKQNKTSPEHSFGALLWHFIPAGKRCRAVEMLA